LPIIVPARNEGQNLRRFLPSLEEQDYPGQRDIKSVRNAICTMMLIPAPPLPVGWLGKPNASHAGACAACGEWLLFTDADVEHEVLSAASAVAFAQAHSLDRLSIFPDRR
jgi:hypothetical protein